MGRGERPGTRSPYSWRVPGRLARQGQSLRSSFCRGLGLTGTALAEAIAVAVHLEDADMMCQPVEQRAGQALGAEGFIMPLPSKVLCAGLAFSTQRFACPKARFARAFLWRAGGPIIAFCEAI